MNFFWGASKPQNLNNLWLNSDTKNYDSKALLADRKVSSETNSTESYANPALPSNVDDSRDDNDTTGDACLDDYDGGYADRQ